jgi:DNA-binding MarR family transcriptional regulator
MSLAFPLPHLRPRREKVFGDGRPRPLDRNAKARIMTYARALMRRTQKGKAYGQVTAKALAVLEALLWSFHNARSGLCFPSYETIAKRAGCARSTVAEALKALEEAGLLSWVNRIVRIKERCADLLGQLGIRVRVIRTSNGYQFNDPKGATSKGFPSKSDFPAGTTIQDFPSLLLPPTPLTIDPSTELGAALLRFQAILRPTAERK